MNNLLDKGELMLSQINGGLKFIGKFDDLFAIIPKAESVPKELYDLIEKREKARLKQDGKQLIKYEIYCIRKDG